MTFKKLYLRHFILLLAGVILFLYGIFSYRIPIQTLTEYTHHKRFQEDFYAKEFQLDDLFDNWESLFMDYDNKTFFTEFIEEAVQDIEKKGISLFIFRNDTLQFWSTNHIPVDYLYYHNIYESPILYMGNGWFYKKEKVFGNIRVLGLISIKSEYSYENKFLKNEYNPDFLLPSPTLITNNPDSSYPIYSSLGDYLFSLDFKDIPKYSNAFKIISLICYLAGILLFLVSLRLILISIKGVLNKNIGLLLFTAILILLCAILINLPIPPHMDSLAFFSPEKFAFSNIFHSLADLFVTSFCIFFLVYNFFQEFRLHPEYLNNKIGRYVITPLYIIILALYSHFVVFLFRSLVMHSSITFETYKVLEINIYTFTGLLIIAFLFTSWALLIDKFLILFKPRAGTWNLVLYLTGYGALLAVGSLFIPSRMDGVIIGIVLLITLIMILVRYVRKLQYTYSTYIFLVFLFSITTVYMVVDYSLEKRNNTKQVLAVDLSAEHDPIAELLLKEIGQTISEDKLLSDLIYDPLVDDQTIMDYLLREYFYGFWEKYDLQYTICGPNDSVYVEPPDDQVYHCSQFFNDQIISAAIQIPGSKFYFIDNMNGRISYFSSFDFFGTDNDQILTLYLELDSRLISGELGYPELLLSEELRSGLAKEYSYAKYHMGNLITQSGTFSYTLKSDMYTQGEREFEIINLDGYNHLIYNIDEENLIILSNPRLKVLDVIISFTYIFAFFYLLVSIILLIVNIPFFKQSIQLNIKNKIQYSMILIIVFSLFLIAGGTIYFSARQYRQGHFESLSERIQSVYIELMHKLAFEQDLKYEWQSDNYRNLDELLLKFSNVFYTDINLYDENGDLLATSRPEVFERGLLGPKIDPTAYFELSIRNRNEFVHEEHIGTLTYLSAYVPFRNNENKLLAYLNLPYFTKQDVLTKEISNLVIGVVNFYVLLITITILLAVFLSNKITQPLRMIQQKISAFTLGKSNEKILYEAEDEIGSLVREYNHMVEELARSAELLARSERESAWREMAKQIAHEIKNPLTPMKLSVQHLLRAWKDEPDKGDKNIEKISQTLIEQIDELSSIATEFSNFAKMPRPNHEKVDLKNRITDIVGLFSNTSGAKVESQIETKDDVIVFADKEQLSRVFINLIKNAVQSIPDEREGLIQIQLKTENNFAVINVKDNGKGIPKELGDRLFQPNFTTKSGGMGMGLAIVKNIVENADGMISYETELEKGTTFIVKLPLCKE